MTAKELKRQYYANYRMANRERLREYKRNWNRAHTQQVKLYTQRYWDKKAKELESNRSP